MKSKHWTIILGIIIIVYWMSYAPALFPVPFFEPLPEMAKECPELSDLVIQENKVNWTIMLLCICGGIISGTLILKRRNYGRIIAVTFSTVILVMIIWYYKDISFKHILFALKADPILFLRNEILRIAIGLATVLYLTRSSVIAEFKKKNSNHSWNKAVHTS